MGSITDQVGTFDTSGVAPGPHADVNGVSAVFDEEQRVADARSGVEGIGAQERAAADAREGWEERLAAKAVAAGSEEYQGAHPPEMMGALEPDSNNPPSSPYPPHPEEGTPDTTGTDEFAAAAEGHEFVRQPMHTDTVDTSGTQGEPNEAGLLASSSLTGAEPATAVASDPKTEPETPNQVDGDPVRPRSDALSALTVSQLAELADTNGVNVRAGARKDEYVTALNNAGVTAPSQATVGLDEAKAKAEDDKAEKSSDAKSDDKKS
jgi:hypothetical protein